MLKEIFALTKASFILNGDLTPRVLPPEQVSNSYVPWSYDYKVTKFTEQRFAKTKRPEIKSLFEKMFINSINPMYGIFHDGDHVVTIKLGDINKRPIIADLSYF